MIAIDGAFMNNNKDLALVFVKWYRDNDIKTKLKVSIEVFVTMEFAFQLGILLTWMADRHIVVNTAHNYVYLAAVITVDTETDTILLKVIDSLINKHNERILLVDNNYLEAVNILIVKYFEIHTLPF